MAWNTGTVTVIHPKAPAAVSKYERELGKVVPAEKAATID
jgi:hypothetical protein